MPSKGKRVASRQGNLRRRRNTANRSNATAPAGAGLTAVASPPSAAAADSAPSGSVATATATPTSATAGVAQAIGRPQSQPRGRRFDRPAAYNHVGPELLRIGIFAGVLTVALVAISFVI